MKVAIFHNLPSGGAKRAWYGFVKYIKNAGNKVNFHVPSTTDELCLPPKDVVSGFVLG